jgi:tRNA U34 5-methylaminomethyl-2-thiouridine-forming methyltransferase MnmC
LREINEKHELWVELGVQTSNDKTLKLIRRGHDFASVKNATKKLANAGIACAAHVILGLPGENLEDYRQTARDIAALPFKAIKLHNLLILKNTPLAKMFADKNFTPEIKPLNEYEYAQAAAEFLRLVPNDYLIMRLNSDAEEEKLIAPKWWMKKGQFLDFFKKYYASENKNCFFQEVETEDGSLSLYHPKYRQHFHTLAGARSEAEKKFIEPARLGEMLKKQNSAKLLDIGFGLGYNALAAVEVAEAVKAGKLQITSLENDLQVLQVALGLFKENNLHRKILKSLIETGSWEGDFAQIVLKIGDARDSVLKIDDKFDCIFLDGFSPDKNPELWTYDFIRELTYHIKEKASLITYSSAYPVRGAMFRCGLFVGKTAAFGRKRGGTIASLEKNNDFEKLSPKEKELILKSTSGTAYRDFGLRQSAKDILNYKKRLVSRLRHLGIPKWYNPKKYN